MAISRAEQILTSMINSTPYDQYPQSRLEDLLLQLKEVIEEGGGGGTPSAENVTYDNTESGATAENVQDALDEVFQSVSDGKEDIADAITDKGVPTSASDSFSTMATNIAAIPSQSVPFDLSNGHFKVYAVDAFNDTFVADSDAYLTLVYLERNAGQNISNIYVNNVAIGFNRDTWFTALSNTLFVGIIHARVQKGDTFTVKCTEYHNSTYSGYLLFGSKDYTADGSPKTSGTNVHNALTKISGNTSSLTYTAAKNGTAYAITYEKNVADSGKLYINGVAQTVYDVYTDGNIHVRMHKGTCQAGDSIQVKPTSWWGTSVFTGSFVIIDEEE